MSGGIHPLAGAAHLHPFSEGADTLHMEELADILGRERVQIEFLLFKILELQHLLCSGDIRFLRWAADEVNRASQRLRTTQLQRIRLVNQLGREAGIEAHRVTLTSLAERAREPWCTIFADYSTGVRLLAGEVDSVSRVTRALADASGHSIADVLEQMYMPTASTIPAPRTFPVNSSVVLP